MTVNANDQADRTCQESRVWRRCDPL